AAGAASPVLYESSLGCPSCFWELVLTGHPTDPDQLALAGVFGGFRLSRDGGQTWSPGTFLDFPIHSDPKALVTADGTLLLSALTSRTNPADGDSVISGVLYRGRLSGSTSRATAARHSPSSGSTTPRPSSRARALPCRWTSRRRARCALWSPRARASRTGSTCCASTSTRRASTWSRDRRCRTSTPPSP